MIRTSCQQRYLSFAPLRYAVCTALVAFLAACPAQTDDPQVQDTPDPETWQATSQRGLYRLRVGPRDGAVRIAQFHEWTVQLLDASGAPVFPARIGMSGGMPGHGHGLPAQPQVTEHLGDGVYRIEGVRFNMAGAWRLAFGIDAPPGRDRVEIDVELTF